MAVTKVRQASKERRHQLKQTYKWLRNDFARCMSFIINRLKYVVVLTNPKYMDIEDDEEDDG
jgi:hypothetical protein